MARDLKVKIRLEGDAKGATKAIKKTESGFKRLGNFLKKNMVAITAAVAVGFFALAKAMGAVVGAAQQQENAVRALDSALIPLGANADRVSAALQAQAAALQKLTGIGDETIIKGQALVASFTKNEEEIKKATAAALDLSAAVGVDLNAAFLLMGKAAAGETTTLTRYGIILEEGIPTSEKFAAALEKVNEQFGGRAAEQAKTYSGAVLGLRSAFSDQLELLGDTVIKNDEFIESIRSLTLALKASEDGTRGAGEAVSDLGSWFISTGANWIALIDFFITGAKSGSAAIEDMDKAAIDFSGSIDVVAERIRQQAIESGKSVAAAGRLVTNFKTVAAVVGNAAEAYDILIASQERANRIAKESAEAMGGFAKEAERLGIVLESKVNAEIERNNAALETARELYRTGEITLRSYENAQQGVADANRELRESLTGVKKETDAAGGAFQGFGRDATEAARGVDALTAANGRALTAAEALAAGRIKLSRRTLTGGPSLISGGGPSSGVFTTITRRTVTGPDGRIEFI